MPIEFGRGFRLLANELSIVAKENTLTIKGEKSANENGKDKAEVLYAASPRGPSSEYPSSPIRGR